MGQSRWVPAILIALALAAGISAPIAAQSCRCEVSDAKEAALEASKAE